jgi:glyoxylase-like metal-dependent hydrolase (beta-lactamase superfamily II)
MGTEKEDQIEIACRAEPPASQFRAMTLEDHVGDVIRKARAGLGVASPPAAAAAGLSPEELATLESGGTCGTPPDYASLARLLTLDGAKLQGVADGWVPVTPNLEDWRELRRVTTREHGMDVHCYLVWDEVTREAALFDTGWTAAPALALVHEEQLNLTHLFLTHSHPDHLGGLEEVRGQFPKVRLHTDSSSAPPQHKNRRNDCIHLGSLRITNRLTPGHAEDGVTYLVGNWPEDAPHVAIVGDALFAGSMGGATGQFEEARRHIREQILSLPPQTLLCPGHGPFTTVAQEREHNPFF